MSLQLTPREAADPKSAIEEKPADPKRKIEEKPKSVLIYTKLHTVSKDETLNNSNLKTKICNQNFEDYNALKFSQTKVAEKRTISPTRLHRMRERTCLPSWR
jgi:hypothetical protein